MIYPFNNFIYIVIGIAFGLFILIRRDWVIRERMKIIEQAPFEIRYYESYWIMLFKFWVWDIDRFWKLKYD
jgi:hypothetical protein